MRKFWAALLTVALAVAVAAGPADAKKKKHKKKAKATTTLVTTTRPATTTRAPTNAGTITLDEFNRLETGMTYDQAVAIIGGPGKVLSQTEVAGIKAIMYMWEGRGTLGANANALFQNGTLVAKAQFGLT